MTDIVMPTLGADMTEGTLIEWKKRVGDASDQISVRQTKMRQTIAAAMSRSKREIPHYYLSMTIDMSTSMTWLAEENRRRSVANRLLYGVLLI